MRFVLVHLRVCCCKLFTIFLLPLSSTMSGRRLRDSVKKVLLANGFPSNVKVVIAGLSNTYSDYVTTFEEYQVIYESQHLV